MSEHITHVAVYEDAMRLIKLAEDRFPKRFTQCLSRAYDSGLLCSAMRGGRFFIVTLLLEQRAIDFENASIKDDERLAASLGAIGHRAADNTFKPMFQAVASDENPHFYEQEAQTFHDAITFEKVYDNGKRPSVSPFQDFNPSTLSYHLENLKGIEAIQAEPFEKLVTYAYLDDFATVRHIDTSGLDAQSMADKIIENVQSPYEPLPWYVQANQNPDPVKLQKYITKPNMYNEEDLIIRLVREQQINGSIATESRFDEAVKLATDEENPQSGYARALGLAWEYLRVAADTFDGRLSENEAYKGFRISNKQKAQIRARFVA
uniref:hypothetical protein n=1 Tax=Ningiella ruwaisensis TaxID=2364274 RepID=UPI001F4FB049|nr:hypothetical protein [Ningiella ruwaisensis]